MSLKYEAYLEKAHWLSFKDKKVIIDFFRISPVVKDLDTVDREKLFFVLCSIPYAEQQISKNGKKLSYYLKVLFKRIKLENLMSQTLSPWQLHLMHHKKFGISKPLFRKFLNDKEQSITYVARYLIEYIGLDKETSSIFADYNVKENACDVALIQHVLSEKYSANLSKDGFLGPSTLEALKQQKFIDHQCDYVKSRKIYKIALLLRRRFSYRKHVIPDLALGYQSRYYPLKLIGEVFLLKRPLHSLIGLVKNRVSPNMYVNCGMQAYYQLKLMKC